jgi:hypothetical protein
MSIFSLKKPTLEDKIKKLKDKGFSVEIFGVTSFDGLPAPNMCTHGRWLEWPGTVTQELMNNKLRIKKGNSIINSSDLVLGKHYNLSDKGEIVLL